VNLPLTRGCKKRKLSGSEDTATDETAPVSDSPGKGTTHHSDSKQCLRRNGTSSIAYVLNDEASSSTTPDQLISPADAGELARNNSRDCDRASLPQVEPESRDAQTLLRLLCFLDGTSIPEFMLIRVKEPQNVWSPSGEIKKVPVTEVGLNSDVLSLVSDNVKIDGAIKQLEAARLITSELGAYGHRTLHIDSAVQLHSTQCLADPLAWRFQALILVCHTFPMHPYVEPL